MRIIIYILVVFCSSNLIDKVTLKTACLQQIRFSHVSPHIKSKRIIRDSILTKFDYKIEKEKLSQDFDQLLESLKDHPDQFEFIDQLSYEKLVNVQRQKLRDSMTVTEFYQIVAPIVSSLGCLHTRIVDNRFFSIPHKYWLPIIVYFKDEKMYAINNCVQSSEMDIGSEIIEINGESTKEIYERLKSIISADAYNANFYRGDLNVNFLYYYHSYYGFDSKYKIKFKPYDSETMITTVFSIDEPGAEYKVDINNTARLNLDITKGDGIAIIRVKNFSYFSRGEQNIEYFKDEIDGYMLKIKEDGIKKIVFDLRGNRGGNPECTAHILSYITENKIDFYEDNELNKRRNRPTSIRPHTNNIAKDKIYFIVDGRCASATTQMLAVVKYNNLAMIVGEETGGTYSTHPGRRVPSLENTKLVLQLGTEREFVSVPKLPLGNGIKPDRIIELDINDIVTGNDPLLKYVLEGS